MDDAGSSGDAALVLVAKTHARSTAVSLPKEGQGCVGGRRRGCEGLYLPRAGTVVCVERADVRYAASRWRAGCAAERRQRVGVLLACCRGAGLLAGALARPSPWPGKNDASVSAEHGACGEAEGARNLVGADGYAVTRACRRREGSVRGRRCMEPGRTHRASAIPGMTR
eukprot:scaffold14902_cov63-Phaeocystis_antarctica.AAC.2